MDKSTHERYIRRCLTIIVGSILIVLLLFCGIASFGIYQSIHAVEYNPQQEHLEHHRQEGERLDKMIQALERLNAKKKERQ